MLTDEFFLSLKENNTYRAEIAPNVWLMDNHKWALLIWEQFKETSGIPKFALAHADYHWDGVYDCHESPGDEQRMRSIDVAELELDIEVERGIRYDSFIAPAIVRGTVSQLFNYCLQDDGDKGVNQELCRRFAAKQTICGSIQEFAAIQECSPLIFDLCLDLFNRSSKFAEGDLWPEAEIYSFLNEIRPLIERAFLVTISLSFDYSGTEADTRYLASVAVPFVLKVREK